MTCIVGMIDKQNNNVYIGSDSCSSGGGYKDINKNNKVFKNGDFIFGCTSSYRMIDLLKYSFKPPKVKTKDINKYMCTDFINKVKECFIKGGFMQRSQDGDDQGGTFLVGYKDRLFRIDDDFQVSESLLEIDACGSGSQVALGSLFTTLEQNILIEDKLLKAMEASEYYATGVQRPFHILKTNK